MNLREFRFKRPNITLAVKYDNQIYRGHIKGFKEDFATLYIPETGETFEFSWTAILRA